MPPRWRVYYNVQAGLVVYWFVTPRSLIGEYQHCSGKCCLHVQDRSAEYDANVINDIVRLRGSSGGRVGEIKSGPGKKERCTSPATVDRPWNLTSWTTICVPYSLRHRRTGRTFHRSLGIQRQTIQKPWFPETNSTETLMSRGKLRRNLDVRRKTIQKPWYPDINYT